MLGHNWMKTLQIKMTRLRVASNISLKSEYRCFTVSPTYGVATYANLADTITLETISSGIMANISTGICRLPTADLLDQMFIIRLYGQMMLKAAMVGAAGYQY